MVKIQVESGGKVKIPQELMKSLSTLDIRPGDDVEITKDCTDAIKIKKPVKTQIQLDDKIKIPDALMRQLNINDGDSVNIVEMGCGQGIKIKKPKV